MGVWYALWVLQGLYRIKGLAWGVHGGGGEQVKEGEQGMGGWRALEREKGRQAEERSCWILGKLAGARNAKGGMAGRGKCRIGHAGVVVVERVLIYLGKGVFCFVLI